MRISNHFKTKQQRYSMMWGDLAEHYNYLIAVGVGQNGKLSIDEHAYLTEVKKELEERADNPKYQLLSDLPERIQ